MSATDTARRLVVRGLRWSPLQPLFLWLNRHSLAVLAYHSVGDGAAFERHVRFLACRYHPVSLAQIIEAVEAGSRLPARSVLVTFDDGDKTIVETALPIMQRYGVPGVLFVVAGSVGSDQPHWWDEAHGLVCRGGRIAGWSESQPEAMVRRLKRETQERRLAMLEEVRCTTRGAPSVATRDLTTDDPLHLEAGGIAVENHTLTHLSLDRCDPETMAGEIEQAHAQLAAILGREPVAFAYPGGHYAEPTRTILDALGYQAGFLFDHRLNRMPISDPQRISRVRVDADVSLDWLAVILSGLHPAVLRMSGRV